MKFCFRRGKITNDTLAECIRTGQLKVSCIVCDLKFIGIGSRL